MVDSLSAGPEIGLLIEKALSEVRAGADFGAVCRAVKAYHERTHLLFALESMHNLACSMNSRVLRRPRHFSSISRVPSVLACPTARMPRTPAIVAASLLMRPFCASLQQERGVRVRTALAAKRPVVQFLVLVAALFLLLATVYLNTGYTAIAYVYENV